MIMEIIALVKAIATILTPALPYLLKMTQKGTEKVGEKIGEAAWNLASQVWEKLSPKIKTKAVKDVFKDVASNPNDPLAQSALEYNLRKILNENITLTRQLEKIVINAPAKFRSKGKNITNISGTIIDGQVITGDKTTIQHGNYSTIIEKASTVYAGNTVNKSAEIREVTIDLKLPDGSYPTHKWVERAGVKEIMLHQSDKVIKDYWEPSGYSGKRLREILMDEVNKWSLQGWEVVETNLDDVWNSDYDSHESAGSAIMGLIGLGVTLTWEKKVVFYSARFHVRRVTDHDSISPNISYQPSKIVKKKEAAFNCPKCGLPFKTKESLKTHKANWHK
jgi:hypothetical protein